MTWFNKKKCMVAREPIPGLKPIYDTPSTKKYKNCTQCNGKGWILEFENDSDGSYYLSKRDCYSCDGEGQLEVRDERRRSLNIKGGKK
jgi:DnaJ-class molecular chaperone